MRAFRPTQGRTRKANQRFLLVRPTQDQPDLLKFLLPPKRERCLYRFPSVLGCEQFDRRPPIGFGEGVVVERLLNPFVEGHCTIVMQAGNLINAV